MPFQVAEFYFAEVLDLVKDASVLLSLLDYGDRDSNVPNFSEGTVLIGIHAHLVSCASRFQTCKQADFPLAASFD